VSNLLGFYDSFNRIQISRCPDVVNVALKILMAPAHRTWQDAVANHRGLLRVAARQKLNAIHDDWSPRCHFDKAFGIWKGKKALANLSSSSQAIYFFPSVNRFLRTSLDIATTKSETEKRLCVNDLLVAGRYVLIGELTIGNQSARTIAVISIEQRTKKEEL